MTAPDRQSTPRRRRKKNIEPGSRGLTSAQAAGGAPPAKLKQLGEAIETDGGRNLATFRDPLGGNWQILAVLPVERLQPTPFQRDLSAGHVQRLQEAIDRLDRFLDPLIAVRAGEGVYWVPNGHHRLAAVRALGGRSVTVLVMPDLEVAYRILALNTEKAHNLREKSLEVIRMARALADLDPRPEREFAVQFEEPAFLTLGICYEQRGRYAGGAYHPVVKRIDAFMAARLPKALETRTERAGRLLVLDDAVNEAVKNLRARGFESAYLKAFVVARVNPLRFKRGAKAEFDDTIEKMIRSAQRFDASKIRADQVAASGGPAED